MSLKKTMTTLSTEPEKWVWDCSVGVLPPDKVYHVPRSFVGMLTFSSEALMGFKCTEAHLGA